MKANEAPEKLYIWFNHPYTVDYAKLNKRRYDEEVEYTRTDAIIEKAKKAMIEWAGTYISKTTGRGVRERKVLATDLLNYFDKYMKGE